MNCIKNERIKNEIIKNECIKNECIKNELIKSNKYYPPLLVFLLLVYGGGRDCTAATTEPDWLPRKLHVKIWEIITSFVVPYKRSSIEIIAIKWYSFPYPDT